MALVKLLKDTTFRKAGEVIDVDDASAAKLVKNGKAVVARSREDATAERVAGRRGNVGVYQVAEADDPNAVVGEPADGETGESAEVLDGETGAVLAGELSTGDDESSD